MNKLSIELNGKSYFVSTEHQAAVEQLQAQLANEQKKALAISQAGGFSAWTGQTIKNLRTAITAYQKIVTDQETQLVNLQVEACLRANDFREVQKEKGLLKERIETLERLIAYYRADYSASFNEARRLRKVIQDNA